MAPSLSLFVEVFPRLGCGNAVITGPDVELEEIKVRDNTVIVGDNRFRIPDKYQFDDILTGLHREDNVISFRMKFKQNERLPVLIENNTYGIYNREKIFAVAPSLTPGQLYNIVCKCGEVIGSIYPDRILPLPSLGWRSHGLEWFCCVKHSAWEVPKDSQGRDILYNAFSVSIKDSNIRQPACVFQLCDLKTRIVMVKCLVCERDLGDLDDHGMVNLWSHNISFKADFEVSPDSKAAGLTPAQVFCDPDVRIASDCFNRVVRAYVREKIEKMPKFVIRNRKGDGYLMWAFDSNLTVLTGDKAGVQDAGVMKILFKAIGIKDQMENIDTLFLSDELFDAGVTDMEESTNNLPQSFRFINGYQCAYISK